MACRGRRSASSALGDWDVDEPALVGQLAARFGESPVHVATPDGYHPYSRYDGGGPVGQVRGLLEERAADIARQNRNTDVKHFDDPFQARHSSAMNPPNCAVSIRWRDVSKMSPIDCTFHRRTPA